MLVFEIRMSLALHSLPPASWRTKAALCGHFTVYTGGKCLQLHQDSDLNEYVTIFSPVPIKIKYRLFRIEG